MYILKRKYLKNKIIKKFSDTNLPSEDETIHFLESQGFNTKKTAITNEKKVVAKYDLKIIIPVYNMAQYVEECVDSVLSQKSEYNVLIQIINDGSTDNSGGIIAKYNKYPFVQIVNQMNRGFSGARNRGLQCLNSQYVMFLDSDDKLNKGAIKRLLDVAFQNDADIVEGSFSRFMGTMALPGGKKHNDSLSVPADNFFGYPWGKVIKAELFKRIQFPENCWFEDSIFSYLVYPLAKNKITISNIVYHYRVNRKGISIASRKDGKSMDTLLITKIMMQDIDTLNIKMNKYIVDLFFSQVCLNFRRTLELDEINKKYIFVYSRVLLHEYLRNNDISSRWVPLYRTLIMEDYGMYSLLCMLM